METGVATARRAGIVLDMHVHLAGLGQGGTGCFMAPPRFNALLSRFLRLKLGIYGADRAGWVDQAYYERLERDVVAARAAGLVHGAVIFAHDRIYDESGDPAAVGQEVYVPNAYAFACARKSSGLFMPAASVHPYRRDAVEETSRWIEAGAAAVKWLPNSQGMDPRHPLSRRIYRLLAERRVPLIVHTGGEHTVRILRPELGDPNILVPALDAGVTVIMAHCGTRSGWSDPNWMTDFMVLARKYPNCYGDTSAFCTPGRARWLPRFLREEGLAEKLAHGSDYPVPPTPWWMLGQLGPGRAWGLGRVWSFLERDVRIKRALGLPEVVFENPARLVTPGSVERWRIACGPGAV
jgi:hypothetical protein